MNSMLGKLPMAAAVEFLARIPVTGIVSMIALLAFFGQAGSQMLEIHLQSESALNVVHLLGCHLLHWSGQHLFWDLGMFIVLACICEQRMPRRFYTTLLVSALCVPWVVKVVHPGMDVYRGLSGLDTALFSLLATTLLIEGVRRRELGQCWLFAIWLLVWVKTLYEFSTGGVLFVHEPNFIPVPVAHLAGSVVGLLTACLFSTSVTEPYAVRLTALGRRCEGTESGCPPQPRN